MEAVPRLHMLWFALKTSPEGTSFTNLKKYIAECYQEDPDSYSKEVYALETLRNTAMRPEKDMEGCSILKRYYCQLHSLANRFPQIAARNLFTFTWKDLYVNNLTEVTDVRFEMAAVLFNIAALHSQVGASVSRSDVDGMKLACTHFQCAAWAFGELKDKFKGMNNNGDFMTPELLVFMQMVSFAQAQECILEKSLIDNRKPAIVAKVTAQIISYYSSALVALMTGGEDGSTSQVIETNVFKLWKKYVRFKIVYLNCILFLYQGQQSEEQQKMGERVVLYQAAWDKLEEAKKESKGLPDQTEIMESLTFTADVVEGKRKNAKNENEFIYHEVLPDLTDIPAIQGANLVNGISFSVTDREIAGDDIFARLVPMKAHEASSLYSEEKANLLRQIGTKIEDKDNELATFMSSLNVEHLNVSEEKANKIPQGIVDRCASINAKANAIPDLIQSMSNLAEICADVETNLKEIKEILNDEDINEKQYQQSSGVHRSNAHFTEMTREYQKYLEAHQKAGDSNDTLRRAMELHVNNLRILSRPLQDIQSSIPKLSGDVGEEIFKDLKLILNKVNEMKAQRAQFHADLRINVNDDDITSKVIANGNNDLKELFVKELGKHDKLTKLIEQNIIAQGNILTALTDTYAKCAPILKTMTDVNHKKENFFSSLAASYDVYEDLLAKSAKGLEFYKKLQGNIQKLLTRVRAARDVQAEDRQQRIKSVTKPNINEITSNNNAGSNNTSSSSSTGPKLKDYLKSNKSGNKYYSTSLDTTQQYIPTIRPNPLGSENPTAAVCATTSSNYYQQQTSVASTAGVSDPPPPYTANLPPTHSQYYDSNGYLNPIYQNSSALYESQQTENYYQGPPPGYSQQQPQYPNGIQQQYSNDNQPPPQYSQIDNNQGFGQQLPTYLPAQGQNNTSYNPQNHSSKISLSGSSSNTSQSYSNTTGYYPQTVPDTTGTSLQGYNLSQQQQQQQQPLQQQQQPLQQQQQPLQQQQPPLQQQSLQQNQLTGQYSTVAGLYDPSPAYNQSYTIPPQQPQSSTSINYPYTVVNTQATAVTETLTNQMDSLNLQNNQLTGYYQNQQPTAVQPDIQYVSGGGGYSQNVSVPLNQSGYQYNQTNGQYPVPYYQYDQTTNSSNQLYNPVNSVTDSSIPNTVNQTYTNQYSVPEMNNQQQQQALPVQLNYQPNDNQNISNTYYTTPPYGYHQSATNQTDQQNSLYQIPTDSNTITVPGTLPSAQTQQSLAYNQVNNNNATATPIPTFTPQNPTNQQPVQQQPVQQQPVQQVTNKTIETVKIKSSNIDLLSDIDFAGSPVITTPPLQPQIASIARKSSIPESSTPSLNTQLPLSPTPIVTSNIEPETEKNPISPEPIEISKNTADIMAEQQIFGIVGIDRKSSCDNMSICSDLSSLDQSFDWDSISIKNDQETNNGVGMVEKTGHKSRDPFDDNKLLKYFHKEVERYEKMIETLNVKMLNGNTPLANKWKELQDMLCKDETKRTSSIGKLFPEKNRSVDCIPYDQGRVVLERNTDDYINAAYVKDLGAGCPIFILAQTPLQNTVNDFWSMIWTQKTKTVVCLHTPNEILDTFWPQELNKEMHFDEFSVILLKQYDLSHCIELNLKLSKTGTDTVLDLSFLQLKAWTKSCAGQILGIARNILVVHKQHYQQFKTNSPLIMNCLTGSERSGLIAVAICTILATKTKRPTLTNVIDVWYRICCQRKSALRDTNNLEFSMEIVLCHAHDVLNNRGIITSYQMKNAQTVAATVKDEIKDPFSDLDPLWKLKNK